MPSIDPHLIEHDHSPLVCRIRETFEHSSAFRDAHISEPQVGSEGEVSVEVRFGSSPALFRVVARSRRRAYALLYELAVSLVGAERDRARAFNGRVEHGRDGIADGRSHPEVRTA
jgi:hypothetical protein